jgi:hypothetical protein
MAYVFIRQIRDEEINIYLPPTSNTYKNNPTLYKARGARKGQIQVSDNDRHNA